MFTEKSSKVGDLTVENRTRFFERIDSTSKQIKNLHKRYCAVSEVLFLGLFSTRVIFIFTFCCCLTIQNVVSRLLCLRSGFENKPAVGFEDV